MGIFDRFKKQKEVAKKEILPTQLTQKEYPIKILVAWGEAIDGNEKIRHWLIKNGYEELGMFCFALRNEDSAQDWLMKKGYPHFVALIKAIEGEKKAQDWLLANKFELLLHVAQAADGLVDSQRYLLMKDKIYAGLAKKMGRVKDDIEWNNNDIHSINP